MNNTRSNLCGQAGISLPELLVVTVVIAIVASLALMQFGGSREQFQRQNVAQQLKQAFERARFDSVKRRAAVANQQAKVIVTATSYTLLTDNNANGVTTDAADSVVTNFTGQGFSITGNSMTFPVTVSFDKRGETATTGAANPIFWVCNGTCTAGSTTNSNANIVLVTPTGTVNLLSGSSTPPNFNAPSNSTIPGGSSSGIKNDVVIP